MNCPKCGNRPLPFTQWICKLNPFRIQCSHCLAQLEAGFTATLWSLCHLPIGFGLVWLYQRLDEAGLFASSWYFAGFLTGAAALLFCTAYVIPYLTFKRVYRINTTSA